MRNNKYKILVFVSNAPFYISTNPFCGWNHEEYTQKNISDFIIIVLLLLILNNTETTNCVWCMTFFNVVKVDHRLFHLLQELLSFLNNFLCNFLEKKEDFVSFCFVGPLLKLLSRQITLANDNHLTDWVTISKCASIHSRNEEQ